MSGAGIWKESLAEALGLGPEEDLVPVGLRVNPYAWPLLRAVEHGNYYAGPRWLDRAGRALHDLPLRPVDYERVVAALVGREDLREAVLSAWDLAASADPGGHSTPRRAQEAAVRALLRAEVPAAVPALDPAGCTCCPCPIPDRRGCRVHDVTAMADWTAEDERRVYPRGRSGPCGVHSA